MQYWIANNTVLEGGSVMLLPLEKEHFQELVQISKDERIWEFYIFDCMETERFLQFLQIGLDGRELGIQFPFVIYHKKTQRLIGNTRFWNINQPHRKLEIGSTWLIPEFWGTEVNLECKLLLLTHCFEVLKTSRVMLRTDEKNIRSQKAIQKIGGQYEGIIRNDMIRDNQTKRNSAYFGLIEEDWTEIKANLMALLEVKRVVK